MDDGVLGDLAQVSGKNTQRAGRAQLYGEAQAVGVAPLGRKIETDSKALADICRVVAEAVKTDFRANHTRELHGHISDNKGTLTTITICDSSHFIVEDEDRILDGRFTALGKVTPEMEEDVPILARNKLLRRINTELIDKLLRDPKSKAAENNEIELMDDIVDDAVDNALDSCIGGASFKVIPIAIYT
ncbi:hypothetical protein [Nocardiopsis trehalosi]|uniref:hypothetical protein n=1 Tax=Nocardiopsis trehalosi TaxID=109329 RepID=UPI00082D3655